MIKSNMNKQISKEILSILEELIPNPVCELNFTNIFELLCAVSLSAQTTDKRVNEITPMLFEKYPDPLTLSQANSNDVFNIIKSLGFAKTKSVNLVNMSKMLFEEFNGEVPNKIEELEKLPGVGRKTANVVLAVGFNIPAFPVDTHLIRMSHRLGYAKSDDTVLEIERKYTKYIDKEYWNKAHHLLLLFGRYHCKAINPKCDECKLIKYCKVK